MTLPTEDVAALVASFRRLLAKPITEVAGIMCSRGEIDALLNAIDAKEAALSTLAGERDEARATPLQARLDAVEGQEPVYKAIERILDEHSAWISRPNHEVTKAIALAATIAAHEIVKGMAASDAVELQGQAGEAAALREFIRTVNRPDDAAMLSEVAAKLYEFQRFKEAKANSPDWEKLWAEQSERADELENLICRIEPHIDAIVCYASTMGEHEPNRIAHEVRAITGRGARDAGPRYETWRDLDEARLATAIMAFFEPCEGSTIDGVRAAILAWEQSR